MTKEIITIYFSKNRPAQLDLALRTNEKHCRDSYLSETVVLYTTSRDRQSRLYDNVKFSHREAVFVRETNFKKDLLELIQPFKYVFFVVDDCIFTHDYSLAEAISVFSNPDKRTLGFSFRLGKNTTYCYPLRQDNSIPNFTAQNGILSWEWIAKGTGDFYYPLEVSSSIYDTNVLHNILMYGIYDSPNTLESVMSINSKLFQRYNYLACYEQSVAFCNPINKVQTQMPNRFSGKEQYSLDKMMEEFESGYILKDVYDGYVSNGCHQEVDIEWEHIWSQNENSTSGNSRPNNF